MSDWLDERAGKYLRKAMICFLLGVSTLQASGQAPAPPSVWDQPIQYDNDGLIVHVGADGKLDGGDTAQREGWYWFGVWLHSHTPGLTPWQPTRKLTFEQVLKLLEPNGDGVFYRHPKLAPWNDPYSKEWGTSRDQLVPLIAAMGVYGKNDELRRLWEALPDDISGKHAFNGNWRNFLGQDGPNCQNIKKRGCDATSDCTLQRDDHDCTREVYMKDCSLVVDNQDCSLAMDTTNCNACVLRNIFTGGCSQMGNDVICEARKVANQQANNAKKAACEATKVANNTANAAAKSACETGKASQQAIFDANKANCEAGKSAKNVLYASQKVSCETAKTAGKYACEADKQLAYQTCGVTNVFSGDLIGPSTTNLMRRALSLDPMLPNLSDGLSTNVVYGGVVGEGELFADSQIRIAASKKNRDDVGDDLNHIVHLIMSKLRSPSVLSQFAVTEYATKRAASYGSYLTQFYATPGHEIAKIAGTIDKGIVSGWKPDVSPAFGAIRWYHRPSTGANPQLAELYKPLVDYYLK